MNRERLLAALVILAALLGGAAIQAGILRPGPVLGGLIRTGAMLDVPPLDDPAMIRRGAAHYDLVCAACHGSPVQPDRAAHLRLSPPAPDLHRRIDGWVPELIFMTVRDGIPDTAMPAWPARGRDDEVWDMVAFLAALPDLDADAYRGLAGIDASGTLPRPLALCVRCHGAEGSGSRDGASPRLDIQSPRYLEDALLAYRAGKRASGFMQAVSGGLSDADIGLLAARFGKGPQALDRMDSGAAAIVTAGLPGVGIPPCAGCHGIASPVRDGFPNLSGQYPDYLARQLHLFATAPDARGGGPFAALMRKAAHGLSDADAGPAIDWYARSAEGH